MWYTNTQKSSSLNACKNILVVIPTMDRPHYATVLCALWFEWGTVSGWRRYVSGFASWQRLAIACSFQGRDHDPQGAAVRHEVPFQLIPCLEFELLDYVGRDGGSEGVALVGDHQISSINHALYDDHWRNNLLNCLE